MELVNIIYKYINRFINSKELVKLLSTINRANFTKEDNEKLDKLIEDVKTVIANTNIEIDEIEKHRIKTINKLLNRLQKAANFKNNDKSVQEFIKRQIASLTKDKETQRDSGQRYEKLYDLLVNNEVNIKYIEKMTDLELLEFITQYISVPVTVKLSQEFFDDLVDVGIDKDMREALWRLANNYYQKGIDFTKIEEYFIKKRDSYYLTELLCAVDDDIDKEKTIEKVIATHDWDFIAECGVTAKNINIISEEEFEKYKQRATNEKNKNSKK